MRFKESIRYKAVKTGFTIWSVVNYGIAFAIAWHFDIMACFFVVFFMLWAHALHFHSPKEYLRIKKKAENERRKSEAIKELLHYRKN